MNWPKNVVPAVCVGLFRLTVLKLRSVISNTGPLLRSSCASSKPPGLPRSASAARTASVGGANDGRPGNIRPNVVGLVATVELRAACARGAKAPPRPPETATAPAPTPARLSNPRLLKLALAFGSSVVLTAAPFVPPGPGPTRQSARAERRHGR